MPHWFIPLQLWVKCTHPDHITCLFWSKKSYLLETLCHSLLVYTTWIWPFYLHVLEFRNLIFHARRCLNLWSTYPKSRHTAKHDITRWKKSMPIARSARPKAYMVTYVNILVLTLHTHDWLFPLRNNSLPARLIKMRRAYVTCFECKWSDSGLCWAKTQMRVQ